jgi:hypothetical protein
MLCEECDKVFHKASSKRWHIRIDVNINNHSKKHHSEGSKQATDSCATGSCFEDVVLEIEETGMLEISTTLREWRHQYGDMEGVFVTAEEGLLFREGVLCVLLQGMRSLLDDRKVKNNTSWHVFN